MREREEARARGKDVLRRRKEGRKRRTEEDNDKREEGRNRFLPCWVGLPEGAGIRAGTNGGRGEGGGELES